MVAVDPDHPDQSVLSEAATLLKRGGLVAFPTETVYGLGAHGLDARACARIFAAKGRPSSNPLILHVATVEQAKALCDWNRSAQILADRFWPGPLTLVLPRKARVPDIVTAGGPTVALRIPNHPVARNLVAQCDFPVAAPSANRSNQVSPTLASHVVQSLGAAVDLILDGGPCPVGIESTVVDLTGSSPVILRPGHIRPSEMEIVLEQKIETGPIPGGIPGARPTGPARSPGLMERHYAPRTPLELLESRESAQKRHEEWKKKGHKVLLVLGLPGEDRFHWGEDPLLWEKHLYRALYDWDEQGWDRILIAVPGTGEAWSGVVDRLRRASQPA